MLNVRHVVGIDEVGRGPLAGPVTVCACVVGADFDFRILSGIKDSKKLSPKKREEWFIVISNLKFVGKLNFVITSISSKEIDSIGIAPSIQKALDASIRALKLSPKKTRVLMDGSLKAPKEFTMQETIIKGDEKVPIISAASIVAKVTRDRHMEEQAKKYPQYGFDKHKGYGTAEHIRAIRKNGPSSIHRKSFLKNI